MLKKKTLSLILCVTLILTAMSCFFVGGATARTFEKYQNEVTMTFEGADKYGLPVTRAYKNPYGNTHTADGFATISNGESNYPSFFFAKADKLDVSDVIESYGHDDDWYTANEGKAAELLYSFDPTKTYRISFKYNPVSVIEDGANFLLCHSVNPIVKTSNIKTIDSTKVVVKNVMTGNSELSKADWKTFTYEFKVSDISATAVYFGIKVNGGCTIQIDDIAIDVVNELEYGFKTVTHDMEDYDVGEVTTIEQCGCKDIQVVDDDGNKVLQFTKINGHARLGFNDQTIEKGKKYYFSFDAKEKDADSKSTAPIVVFGNKGGGNGDRRIAIVNDAFSSTNSFTTAGCKYYIDGVEVTHDNFKYSTEWRTYGISFDTSNTDFLKVVSDKYSDFWSKTTYLLFGAQNGVVMYDNISLTGVKDIEITSMPSEKPAVTAYSIRGEQKVEQYVSAGLRFKGSVAADKVEGAEIGFVVAPTPSIYNVEDWYDLNKTVADRETVKYNKGEYYSYNADKEVYEYQLILSGLSTAAGATAYEVPFAAVLYVKSGDTYTYYSLGQTSYGEIGAAYAVQNQTAAAQ